MPARVQPFPSRLGNFTTVSDRRYVMDVPSLGIKFDLSRIRREHHELTGELVVHCSLAGARTIDGVLAASDFNCSGQQSRITRAKFLADRAQTKPDEVDWIGLVEEFCQRAVKFDQQGTAKQVFADIALPDASIADEWTIMGLPLLARHPVIWFGDGGAAKSMLALYVASELARAGQRVLYADWEFTGEDHRARLQRLCNGRAVPGNLWYAWCSRPLTEEVERLAAMVADDAVNYIVCDSVSFACAGAPESAEAASNYFRALRALKIGSLNIAHVTKGDEEVASRYPFGSIFWHDGAKATWFLKRASEQDDGDIIDVAFLQRKSNIGRKRRETLGLRLGFSETAITVDPFNVASHQELSVHLPLWQRIQAELSHGALMTSDLAERLGAKESTIRTAMTRGRMFVRLPDGRVALSAGYGPDSRSFVNS